MPLMQLQPAQPYAPPESQPLRADVSHAVWYPFHQTAGTEVSCALGNGPVLTLNEDVGSIWGTWGCARPNTTQYFTSPAGNAYLNALGAINTLGEADGEIIFGLEQQHGGACTADSGILHWGISANAAASAGAWRLQLLKSVVNQRLAVHGGNGGSANVNAAAFSGGGQGGITARSLMVYSLYRDGPSRLVLDRYPWVIGTGMATASHSVVEDMLASGGGVPAANANTRLTVCAVQNGTASWATPIGNGTASNYQINNLWMARLPSRRPGLAYQAMLDMAAAPREFPKCLRSAP